MHTRAHNAFAPAIRSRARRRQISPSSSSSVCSCCLACRADGKKKKTRGVDFTPAFAACRTAVACCVTSSGLSMAGELATSRVRLQLLQTKQVSVVSTHVTLGVQGGSPLIFLLPVRKCDDYLCTVTVEPLLAPFQCLSISVPPLVQQAVMGRPHQWEDLQTMIEDLGLHLIRHFFIMFWATVWHCCAHQWNDLASKLSYSVQAKH